MLSSLKAKMLNNKASHPKSKADKIIEVLNIPKGSVVVDIGCGGGYFTFRFAKQIGPHGTVIAVDTDAKVLNFIKRYAAKNDITNIKPVLVKENRLPLEEKSCDFIFLRNVFHHIKKPQSYFTNVKPFLKPDGKIIIIDYNKASKKSLLGILGHNVEEVFIQDTMKQSGYKLIKRYDFLPEQSFNVFQIN